MKKTEIIELNGVEYTLELNRDSFIQIDKVCNVVKTLDLLQSNLYEYKDEEELPDDYNPFSDIFDDKKLEEEIEKRGNRLEKLITRSFHIWLYPNYKYSLSQVKEILKPYLDDDEKAGWIGEKVGDLLRECVEIRQEYNEQSKNLKAQANK